MLNAEMDVHLDDEAEKTAGNHRNGGSQKPVLSDDGELVLSIPRDREGCFDPALIANYLRDSMRTSSPCTGAASARGTSKRTSASYTV